MRLLLKTSTFLVLFSGIPLAKTEEKTPTHVTPDISPPAISDSSKETIIPKAPEPPPEVNFISLDDAIKIVLQTAGNKVLGAKTELEGGRKIHIIKVLTPAGYIQHVRIDAASGKILEKAKK